MFYKTVAIWLCQIVYPHIPVKYEKYNLLYVFARHFLKEHQDPTLSKHHAVFKSFLQKIIWMLFLGDSSSDDNDKATCYFLINKVNAIQ